jgi:protein FrlC
VVLRLGASNGISQLELVSLGEALKGIAALKFRFVELFASPPHAWHRDMDKKGRRELHETLRSLGLQVVSINPGFPGDLANAFLSMRELTKEEYKAYIDLARDLDCKTVIIGVGRKGLFDGRTIEKVREVAIQGVREIVRFGDDRGIVVGAEASPVSITRTGAKLRDFIDEVRLGSLGAVYDSGNIAVTGESQAKTIEGLGESLVHVHLCDNDCVHNDKLPIGQGKIDFAAIYNALKGVGYDGYSTLELFYPKNPDLGLAESKRKLEQLGWQT